MSLSEIEKTKADMHEKADAGEEEPLHTPHALMHVHVHVHVDLHSTSERLRRCENLTLLAIAGHGADWAGPRRRPGGEQRHIQFENQVFPGNPNPNPDRILHTRILNLTLQTVQPSSSH